MVWYEGTTTANKTWLYQDQLGNVAHSYGSYGDPSIATGIRSRYTSQ